MPNAKNPSGLPPQSGEEPTGGIRSAVRGIFRKDGDFWTVGYGEKVFRLKDSTGFAYIGHLLRYPATEFHVLDLGAHGTSGHEASGDKATLSAGSSSLSTEELEASGIHVGNLGDAGEVLDDQAKAAYKARLRELAEELEDAKEFGNIERAAKAEEEIDALSAELSRGVGLGGRRRRAGSATERARQRAKKGIKTAIDRIAKNDPALGRMLAQRIRTGIYCSYRPDPNFPVEWQFAVTPSAFAPSPSESWGPVAAAGQGLEKPDISKAADLLGPVLAFSNQTVFAGREAEISRLSTVVDGAANGQGSLVMIGGGPGVGKTRLAREAAKYAGSRGFRFLMGRCYEGEQRRPYLPFEEIIEMALREAPSVEQFRSVVGDNATELAQIAPALRRVFPGLPPPLELPAQETRRYLFQSVTDTFMRVARRVPLLLVLDDLQWADEASLALLIHLAYRVTQMRLLVAVTYRDIELDHSSPFARTLEELQRTGSVSRIRLRGLGEGEVAVMVRGLSQRDPPGQLVKVMFDETQGNPFFIEELYKHLVEEGKVFDAAGQFRLDIKLDEVDVPDKIRLVVGRRLDRLGKSGRQILTAAAIIGRSFGFKLLETVLSHVDVDDLLTAIEQAERLGLVVPSSEGPQAPFQFSHELIRQTLLADASLPRRQLLHLRVADAIEKAHAEVMSENAVEIVNHLSQAGSLVDGQRLALYLETAGKNALEASAYEEALNHFQSALSFQGALAKRAELLVSLAMAERGLGRWNAALTHLGESLEITIGLGDPTDISRIFSEFAEALLPAGRYEEAGRVARRGLDRLQQDLSADRVRLLCVLGLRGVVTGAYEPAEEALREALTVASQLFDPNLVARVLGDRCVLNSLFLRLRDAVADGAESERVGGSKGAPWPRAVMLRTLHLTLLFLGRLEEAARIADEVEPLARRIGQSSSISTFIQSRAWTEFGKAPDLAKLEVELQEAWEVDRGAGLPVWISRSEAQLSELDFIRGRWDSALDHAQAACRPEPRRWLFSVAGTLFRQLAYAGDRAGAFAILNDQRTRLPVAGQLNSRDFWATLLLAVDGLVILGEQQQAAQLYPLVRQLVDTGAVFYWWIPRAVQTIAGVAAGAARNWDAAEEHFQIALRQAESFPHRLEIAEINRFHAAMLLDRNASQDRERARGLLDAALEGYTQIGMPRHVEIAKALLDRSGGS